MFGHRLYHMNRKLLTLVLLILAFAACRKDETDLPTKIDIKQSILGKWHYTADTVKMYTNGAITQTYPTGGVTSAYWVQYNSDGTGQSGIDGKTDVTKFTYSINNNILTVTNTGSSPENAKIKKLTSNRMILFYDDSSVSNGVTSRTTEVAYFSK